MKAMILAAGLGTRLKPWTLEHPKALVPVGGVPMLERVILKLKSSGFDQIVINIHHFGEQIIEFVESRDFGVDISISDERGRLLDTGGGILHAEGLLRVDEGPVLIHNVD
ncbi:MAG: NTP transferase domain-containing protein, partial [Muribaculaceae bacterium]|nr:NTP transferase domain-containing protein [Muribaculaceae bacterium]